MCLGLTANAQLLNDCILINFFRQNRKSVSLTYLAGFEEEHAELFQ